MKILILDDKASVTRSLKKAIEPSGHKCISIQHPAEAMEVFKSEKFDLVITDLKMPTLNGIEILQMIKKSWPETPVIVFSGFANVDDVIAALNYGASAFFKKPFEVGELLDTIKRIEKNSEKKLESEKYNDLIKEEIQNMKESSENIIKYMRKLNSK